MHVHMSSHGPVLYLNSTFCMLLLLWALNPGIKNNEDSRSDSNIGGADACFQLFLVSVMLTHIEESTTSPISWKLYL